MLVIPCIGIPRGRLIATTSDVMSKVDLRLLVHFGEVMLKGSLVADSIQVPGRGTNAAASASSMQSLMQSRMAPTVLFVQRVIEYSAP